MSARRHWSEYTKCLCGKRLRIGSLAEARHRHNFPLLCQNKNKLKKSLETLS
jgi:hypothetical protein